MFEPLETKARRKRHGGWRLPSEVQRIETCKYLVRITAGDGITAINPVDPIARSRRRHQHRRRICPQTGT
jgi:hypothetical protein